MGMTDSSYMALVEVITLFKNDDKDRRKLYICCILPIILLAFINSFGKDFSPNVYIF